MFRLGGLGAFLFSGFPGGNGSKKGAAHELARQLDRSMPLLLLLLISVYIPQNVILLLLAQAQPLQGLAGAAVRADKLCAVPRDRRGASVGLAAFGADG